jgi:hypothetical protein
MWDDRFAETCARHADLVAVFESAHGRLGLLLRQTLVPLDAERLEWLAETRAVARHLIADLRGVGFSGGAVVLQWLPMHDVARIVGRWVRRWDGDPARRSQLLSVVERKLMDERYLAGGRPRAAPAPRRATRPTIAGGADVVTDGFNEAGLDALKAWYEAMAPCWLAIQPARRRRLVLQSHVWIADQALADPAEGPRRASAELGRDGSLARALELLVPRAEAPAWRPWIDLVRTDLARALSRPPALRTQAWARWLFLIPYSVPVPRRGLRATRPVGDGSLPPAWTAKPWRAKMEA